MIMMRTLKHGCGVDSGSLKVLSEVMGYSYSKRYLSPYFDLVHIPRLLDISVLVRYTDKLIFPISRRLCRRKVVPGVAPTIAVMFERKFEDDAASE